MSFNLICKNNKCKYHDNIHCIKFLNNEAINIDTDGKCEMFKQTIESSKSDFINAIKGISGFKIGYLLDDNCIWIVDTNKDKNFPKYFKLYNKYNKCVYFVVWDYDNMKNLKSALETETYTIINKE